VKGDACQGTRGSEGRGKEPPINAIGRNGGVRKAHPRTTSDCNIHCTREEEIIVGRRTDVERQLIASANLRDYILSHTAGLTIGRDTSQIDMVTTVLCLKCDAILYVVIDESRINANDSPT